jgi:hypothetical protein
MKLGKKMKGKNKIKEINLRLLKPYTIPEECPYLSEEQRELSKLTLEKRAEWMAEWLYMANGIDEDD